eukprot:Hpha_TRINITY_DN15218_c0_g1::TRINITY_DN15218_c0_g1_i1::g.65689::m.65689
MGGCCPGKADKDGNVGRNTSSSEQRTRDRRSSRGRGSYHISTGGSDDERGEDDLRSHDLSPLHCKSRPTLLGGEKDSGGLYKVPESREFLNLSGEDRTEWPTFANTAVVRRLDLSYNRITSLPTGGRAPITLWENLESLNLARNSLKDVPAALKELPHLTSLDVSGNVLRRSPEEPCSVLPSLSKLKILSIADCRLEVLPRGVTQCSGLQDLDIGGNARIMLERSDGNSISQLRKLEILNLSRTQLRAIPTALGGCTEIHTLDLSEGAMENPAAGAYDVLGRMRVKTLLLRNNPRTHQGLFGIPPEVARLQTITSLDLSGNRITNLDLLSHMKGLKTLILRTCNLRRLWEPLLKSRLSSLDLSGNPLTAESIQVLRGTSLSKEIETLILCCDAITFVPKYASMDVIGELPKLQEFWFDVWADKKNAREEKAVIYSSRVPAQLARPRLELLNGVPSNFKGTLASSFVSVMKEGSLKLDFDIHWEEETRRHVNLILLFNSMKDWLLDHTAEAVARYRLFLANFQAELQTERSVVVPPLDVLYVMYCHVIRPQYFASDMARNNLKLLSRLLYPVEPEEKWENARPKSGNDIFAPGSRYMYSARLWNDRIAGSGAGWLKFEWFVSDAAPPSAKDLEGVGSPLSFELDLEEEMQNAMVFIEDAVQHADALRQHWYFISERYMKFFGLRMLAFERARGGKEPTVPISTEIGTPESDDPDWVPTLGIMLNAHTHQCIPAQYRHDMLWYAGRYVGCSPPLGEERSPVFQGALKKTSALWEEAYGEEYVSQDAKLARSPWGITTVSPLARDRKSRRRTGSIIANHERKGSGASGRASSVSPEALTKKESKVRFAGGGSVVS